MIAAAYYVVIASDLARSSDPGTGATPRPSVFARLRALASAVTGRRGAAQPA